MNKERIACLSTLLALSLLPTGCNRGKEPAPDTPPPDAEPAPAAAIEADDPSDAVSETRQNWVSPATNMEFVWLEDLNLWAGRYEVTNEDYRAKAPDHDSGRYRDQSLNENRQPVTRVNFEDAIAFGHWLTEQDREALPAGYAYRLPTEQEWLAYALCGGEHEYPWGADWPPTSGQAGNYRDATAHGALNIETDMADYKDGFAVAAPVEQTWANAWGLHGVGGNVWEACLSDNDHGKPGAWRGASWYNHDQRLLKAAYRYVCESGERIDISGFRLVLAPIAP